MLRQACKWTGPLTVGTIVARRNDPHSCSSFSAVGRACCLFAQQQIRALTHALSCVLRFLGSSSAVVCFSFHIPKLREHVQPGYLVRLWLEPVGTVMISTNKTESCGSSSPTFTLSPSLLKPCNARYGARPGRGSPSQGHANRRLPPLLPAAGLVLGQRPTTGGVHSLAAPGEPPPRQAGRLGRGGEQSG